MLLMSADYSFGAAGFAHLTRDPAGQERGEERTPGDAGSMATACVTRPELGEVVEGDVPDDFDDELGRESGGGVV